MTTKLGILSLREKQRIEELIKCSREKKRLNITAKLEELRLGVESVYNEQIERLQRQSENIRVEREKAVIKAGFDKIRERGCYDTHPDLNKFDAETNKILIRLWKTSDAKENQFDD